MSPKPYVQKVFTSMDDDIVKKDAETFVGELVKKGYSVKVTVENYIAVWDNQTTHMVFQTTVLATAHKKVDIGLKK